MVTQLSEYTKTHQVVCFKWVDSVHLYKAVHINIYSDFIEPVTILLLSYVLIFWPGGKWALCSLTRDQTYTLVLEGEILTTALPGKSRSYCIF